MLNYMKSEWYRIIRGREIYLFTGIFCSLVLIMNLILFVSAGTLEDFPYGTVHFSLSNFTANPSIMFMAVAILVPTLYADAKKNGIVKNALAHGLSRSTIFVANSLISCVFALLSMLVILVVMIGCAVLLLEGPIEEPIVQFLSAAGAALPSSIAIVVFTVAAVTVFKTTTNALVFWLVVVLLIPNVFHAVGSQFEVIGLIASWMPTNFLAHEVMVNMSGFNSLWQTSFGVMKCIVAGFGCLVLFGVLGLWRVRKVEY